MENCKKKKATLQTQLRLQYSIKQQTSLPETIDSARRPAPFYGYDSEHVNGWLDKIEYYLTLRRIDLASRTAQAELVMNLAAEDFHYYDLAHSSEVYIRRTEGFSEREICE